MTLALIAPFLVALIPLLIKLYPYLLPLIAAGIAHIHFKNTKAEAVAQKLKDALDQAERAVGPAVRAVVEAYLASIGKAAADGIVTPEEEKAARLEAEAAALKLIPAQYLDLLKAAFPGSAFDDFIGVQLDAAIHDYKLERAKSFATVPGLSH